MPCLNISTNVNLDGVNTSAILSEASSQVAKIIKKPESVRFFFPFASDSLKFLFISFYFVVLGYCLVQSPHFGNILLLIHVFLALNAEMWIE
jgi:hypothetical protein